MSNSRVWAIVRWGIRWVAAVALAGFPGGWAAADDARQDYLIFVDATAEHRNGPPTDGAVEPDEGKLNATVLYSWDGDRFRFFAEAHGGDEGAAELARFQLGWRFVPQTTAWIGRFHNPQGYWNTQYHHGAYLQTSISRPGIEQFDDDGGVLPSHFIGAQLDGTRPLGQDGSLRYELGMGVSGQLDEEGLESPLLIGPQRSADPTASLRLTYSPQEGGLDSFGLFVGQNRLTAEDLGFEQVRQTVAGVSANRVVDSLRLIGAVFFLRNEIQDGAMAGARGDFMSGYLQAEYQFNALWTPYVRAEASHGTNNDPYLALFPRFVQGRGLAGLRRDIGQKHALKIEAGRAHVESGRYNEVSVQWSMVFP